MSLIEDLRAIDVSQIVSARGQVTASIQAPGVSAAVSAGPASSALGSLGSALDALRSDFPDAGALIRPLGDALGGLSGKFGFDHLPLLDLTQAMGEGLEFVIGLAGSVTGDTADFGRVFGTPLGEAMRLVGDRAGHAGTLLGAGADVFAALAGGEHTPDVGGVVKLAAEILLPLPHATLASGGQAIANLLTATDALRLPDGRFAGLTAALNAVAAARTPAALDAAIAGLVRARSQTVSVLADDLAFVAAQTQRLRPSQLLQPLAAAGAGLRHGRDGVIEYLTVFRQEIADFRVTLTNPDLNAIRAFIQSLAPMLEAQARETVEAPIDRAVLEAKEFIRRKLRELPVRALRQEVTNFLHELAQTIEHSGLDAPARAAREALGAITRRLDPAGITAAVRAALAEVTAALHAALDGVIAALDVVVARVDALAGQAQAVLARLAAGLAAFRGAIDGITAAITGLGIDAARDQMITQLRTLRDTVSRLLSAAPLPEPLKPQVEQLARLIEGVDLDAAFAPVRAVAAQLKVPAAAADAVRDGLAEAARVVDNLIPATLAESLSAEIADVLKTVNGFNPASLLPDIRQYLEAAARLLEELDPRPAAETIRPPFQAALDAFDRVHPARLLAPVIAAYDSLLARVPVPEAQTLVKGVRASFDAAGNVAARAVVEPAARSAGGQGGDGVTTPGATRPVAEIPPPLTDVRAGDAIRMIGAVPARVRAALQALEAGPAGEVVRALDALAGGLARQLRGVAAAMNAVSHRLDADFDALLAALGPAQLSAQFALHANFSADAGRLTLSLDAVASASPAALRADLAGALAPMRAATHALFADSGSLAADLDRLATGLEATPLAHLEGDLDALLAALDPEPVALEIDRLVNDLIALTPTFAGALLPDLRAFVDRLKALFNHFNPGAQVQKFVGVLDVIREELEMFDPRRLAGELAEVHGAIKATIAAYDPRVLAEELLAVTRAAAGALRALDPATLLGDLAFLTDLTAKLTKADPGPRLAAIGGELTQVGQQLRAIDLGALIEQVNKLGPTLEADFEALIKALQAEIVALLDALRFAGGSASGSVSVSVG